MYYFKSDPEFIDATPIRQGIEVLPADEPRDKYQFHDNIIITSKGKIGLRGKVKPLTLGWTVRETIGVAVVNTRAIKHLSKSIIIGE